MLRNQHHLWDRLSKQLECLDSSDYSDIVPLLLDLNLWLKPNINSSVVLTRLLTMETDVKQFSEGAGEEDRLQHLTLYFFETLGFRLLPARSLGLQERDLFLDSVLTQKKGHGLIVSLIFTRLAESLKVPIQMVDIPGHYVLKWVKPGQSIYFDLSKNGTRIQDREIIDILKTALSWSPKEEQFDRLSAKTMFLQYLSQLIDCYESLSDFNNLGPCLDAYLLAEPFQFSMLLKRVFLHKNSGRMKEAFEDLKRYFSFNERSQSPAELQQLFCELESQDQRQPTGPTLFH